MGSKTSAQEEPFQGACTWDCNSSRALGPRWFHNIGEDIAKVFYCYSYGPFAVISTELTPFIECIIPFIAMFNYVINGHNCIVCMNWSDFVGDCVGFYCHDNESPKTQESLTLSLVFGKCMRMSENGSYRQLYHFNREVIMNLFSYRTKLLCGFVSN